MHVWDEVWSKQALVSSGSLSSCGGRGCFLNCLPISAYHFLLHFRVFLGLTAGGSQLRNMAFDWPVSIQYAWIHAEESHWLFNHFHFVPLTTTFCSVGQDHRGGRKETEAGANSRETKVQLPFSNNYSKFYPWSIICALNSTHSFPLTHTEIEQNMTDYNTQR